MFVVSDTKGVQYGEQCKVLGTFNTELEAAIFIEKLPGYLTGRYALDPPSDDELLLDERDEYLLDLPHTD